MLYKDFLATIEGSMYQDWKYDDELGQYIFMGDIDIAIKNDREWQLEGDDEYCFESWATNNPDSKAYRKRYYLMFRGNIIETVYGASVDGMRCFIPYPKVSEMTITRFQYAVGEIINNAISEYSDFEHYLSKAGITVI